MAGEDNLIPLSERTKDERREIAKKAGIASGKARRKKANLKRTLETVLSLDLPPSKLKQQLEDMDLDPSMEQGLVLSVVMRTVQEGRPADLKIISDMLQQNMSLADKREQKARTAKIQAEADMLQANLAIKNGTAGEDLVAAQSQAIADMINSPTSERILEDFMGGVSDDDKHEDA